MKNDKNKDVFIDLTNELYVQISGAKQNEISNLKTLKTKILNEIKEYFNKLNELNEQKKQIKKQIKINKKKLRESRFRKFKINRNLKRQVRLVKDLNNTFIKDDISKIDFNAYYPEKAKKIGQKTNFE